MTTAQPGTLATAGSGDTARIGGGGFNPLPPQVSLSRSVCMCDTLSPIFVYTYAHTRTHTHTHTHTHREVVSPSLLETLG